MDTNCIKKKCKNCKIEKEKFEFKNNKICKECFTKKLTYCKKCEKYFFDYFNHDKLHQSKSLIEKPLCKYCNNEVKAVEYYFSINKCKNCHREYKQQKIKCEKCNKEIKRSYFYKHKCL